MIGRPSPSASAREAKLCRMSWMRTSWSPVLRADGLPRPVDVGHVHTWLGARNDPGDCRACAAGPQGLELPKGTGELVRAPVFPSAM